MRLINLYVDETAYELMKKYARKNNTSVSYAARRFLNKGIETFDQTNDTTVLQEFIHKRVQETGESKAQVVRKIMLEGIKKNK